MAATIKFDDIQSYIKRKPDKNPYNYSGSCIRNKKHWHKKLITTTYFILLLKKYNWIAKSYGIEFHHQKKKKFT